MSLSYNEAKLVRATIPSLRDHGEHIATVFYKTMLRNHPELNDYFNNANMQSGAQPRALTSLILAFASNINHISEIIPMMERVAQKHASLNIQAEDYDIVGKYLLRAFAAVLGPNMTTDVRLAWNKAYWIMSRMLSSREAQIYKEFEPWSGWRKFMVQGKKPETEDGDIVSFILKPVDGNKLPLYMPGQYVSLRMRVAGMTYMQIRQYSLSDIPSVDSYRITVKRYLGQWADYSSEAESMLRERRSGASIISGSTAVSSVSGSGFNNTDTSRAGLVSNALIDDIQEGDVVELTHPAGDFGHHADDDSTVPIVLISAGIGAAPLLSILNTIIQKQPNKPVSWVHGSRQSAPFEAHVRVLAAQHPNLRTSFFKTRLAEPETATYTHDFKADLSYLNRDDLQLQNGSTKYFICGPDKFMFEMESFLKSKSVSKSNVHFEPYSTGSFELKS
ncbi:hypothetical protein DL764_008501 [Monosporascus ibericus]|uniref:nitric oxide dioxygenase n=1 Tax=Monosporascus ibericus TaxID=155417 RepID=A0A4Q4SXD3_9PEZI|nr:hypothetical protein DL764_008501 [Monosporascus ibericus]